MQADWCNEKIIRFLELLEGERVIWDPTEKNHKLKHKVHDGWKRISQNMENISIKELKAKKKSLMATFRPLLKKKKKTIKSGAGTDEVFQPIWYAFDIMERFLGRTYDVEETLNTEDEVRHSDIMLPTPSPSSIQAQQSHDMPLSPTKHKKIEIENSTVSRSNFSRKRLKNAEVHLDEAEKRISDSFNTLSRVLEGNRVEEDECDAYAKLLAKKLRKYPERMRDRIMYKIDGLLLDNPYPEEQPSSSASSLRSPYPYYPNTPSPIYIVTHSPNSAMQVNMQEGNET